MKKFKEFDDGYSNHRWTDVEIKSFIRETIAKEKKGLLKEVNELVSAQYNQKDFKEVWFPILERGLKQMEGDK